VENGTFKRHSEFFLLQVGSGIMRKDDPFQRQIVSGFHEEN
jgi:hypothetical protein